jgi:octaprenyl-diphosphate synthase
MIAIPGDHTLLNQIIEEVKAVEEELTAQMGSNVELVQSASRHTLDAGGKRLRPAFVALSARAVGSHFESNRTCKIGACMEMIHMATLIHDDVIDHAATRRGKPTASSIFGNTAAILSGDVLLAKAMVILAHDGDLNIIRAVSESVVEMAEGEVRELEIRGCYDLTEAEHLQILRMKTASFIQCCCEAGAMIAGASERQRKALGTFGHHIGMAFQVIDDLLDFRSDKTGKPKAGDFREGQATLPLIYLRDELSPEETELTRRSFGNGAADDVLAQISTWMAERGSFVRAEAAAHWHVEEAIAALDDLPESAERDLLSQVGDFVLSRQA